MQRRDYSSNHDFRVMQALTQRVWSTNPRWHVGELAWSRFSLPAKDAGWRSALWFDGDPGAGAPLSQHRLRAGTADRDLRPRRRRNIDKATGDAVDNKMNGA